MEIRFNLTGAARKELVEAIGGIVGWAPVYKKAPTFAYVVNNYTIDKNGTLICDERTDSGDVHSLLTELVARGFVYEDVSSMEVPAAEHDGAGDAFAEAAFAEEDGEDTPAVDAPAGEHYDSPLPEDSGADADSDDLPGDVTIAADDPADEHFEIDGDIAEAPLTENAAAVSVSALSEVVPTDADPDRLVIEVPLDGFTPTALDNLDKLVASKAALIKKALGAADLPIEREGDRLCFPWFTLGSSPDEAAVYTQFVHALCEMAKKQQRVVAKEKPADSEKFAFRCFLLRLGFIGSEYAAARKLLLANLPGDGSFKSGKRKEREDVASQAANAADSGAEDEVESSRR